MYRCITSERVTEEEQLDAHGRLERCLSVGDDSLTPQEVP